MCCFNEQITCQYKCKHLTDCNLSDCSQNNCHTCCRFSTFKVIFFANCMNKRILVLVNFLTPLLNVLATRLIQLGFLHIYKKKIRNTSTFLSPYFYFIFSRIAAQETAMSVCSSKANANLLPLIIGQSQNTKFHDNQLKKLNNLVVSIYFK